MSAQAAATHSWSQHPDRNRRDWVTSGELQNESGISWRQLDYWVRTGLLETLDNPNPGAGWTRRFHDNQLTRARVIRELLAGGMTLPTVRRIVDCLIETGRAEMNDALTIIYTEPS